MPRKTVAVIGLSLLTGCGFLGFTFPFIRPPDPAPTGSAKLLPFASQQDLLDYFGGQVQSRNESGLLFEATGNAEDQNLGAPGGGDGAADDSIGAAPSPPTAQPTDGDGRDSGNSFSETTTQEAGVGEADVVKTDGASLYVITGERLRVVQVMPSTSQLALSPEVALEGYGRNIYLHDGKVIALTETYGGYFGGPIAVDVGVAVDPVSTDVIAAQDDGVKQDVGGTTDEVGSVDVSVSVPPEGQGDFAPQYERPKTIVTVVDEVEAIPVVFGPGMSLFLKPDDPSIVIRRNLAARHDVGGSRFSLSFADESDGTQRFLNLLPALYHLRDSCKVFVIDELDRSLHPLLSHALLKFFVEVCPGACQQLIVTTHETHLLDLDLLRRDEIWFVEKDDQQQTHLFSLADLKVRKDLRLEKSYLQGRFGGIPFIGGTERLKDLVECPTGR